MPLFLKGVQMYHWGTFTIATLPTAAANSTLAAGDTAYASNGRKASEGGGSGTGTLVFFDGTNWIRPDTGATAVA